MKMELFNPIKYVYSQESGNTDGKWFLFGDVLKDNVIEFLVNYVISHSFEEKKICFAHPPLVHMVRECAYINNNNNLWMVLLATMGDKG